LKKASASYAGAQPQSSREPQPANSGPLVGPQTGPQSRRVGIRQRLGRPQPAQRLFKALEGARLRCAAGGSYHSVTAAVDPGLAMRRIHTLFQQANGAVISVGSSEVAAEFAARMSSPPNGAGDHGNGQALRHWAQAQVGVVATLRRWDARTAM